jgi:hypothetical protein
MLRLVLRAQPLSGATVRASKQRSTLTQNVQTPIGWSDSHARAPNLARLHGNLGKVLAILNKKGRPIACLSLEFKATAWPFVQYYTGLKLWIARM